MPSLPISPIAPIPPRQPASFLPHPPEICGIRRQSVYSVFPDKENEMKALRQVVLAAVVVSACSLAQAEDKKADWKSLMPGKDLEGWTTNTPEKFKMEDGCLVGWQTDGKGGDIFTKEEFDNFELRFTYKVNWPANSGVWYRTGYQFDILKYVKPKTFSGAMYYPGCPTTFAFVNLDESIENRDGWNEAVVYANGDKIVHWLNGKKIGEATVSKIAKGKVGVQVHGGGGFKNMKITIKSIEIRSLAKDEGPSEPKK